MREDHNTQLEVGRARLLGGTLAIVAVVALALRLWQWSRDGQFSSSRFVLPVGTFLLALPHLIAPGNRRAYEVASALFILLIIADFVMSGLDH